MGAADDGIAYQGITKHLQFQLVFKEKYQAEDFETTVMKIPRENGKRKRVEFATDAAVVPDIIVEVSSSQRTDWLGDLVRIEEDQYEKIGGNAEPSSEYDMDGHSQTSAVSVDTETRLRMTEA